MRSLNHKIVPPISLSVLRKRKTTNLHRFFQNTKHVPNHTTPYLPPSFDVKRLSIYKHTTVHTPTKIIKIDLRKKGIQNIPQ